MIIINNPIAQSIIDTIQPMINNIPVPTTGWVLEYHKATNRANIEMDSHKHNGKVRYDNIPVLHLTGFNKGGPLRGQEVLVLFIGDDRPIVIGDIDLSYSYHTRQNQQSHKRKGGWLADSVCNRTGDLNSGGMGGVPL